MNKSNNSQEQVNIKHFYINNSEIKVIMLGSSNSGKTSFINHLQNESINTEPTRSPKINKINLEIFSLSITDTAGQDRYRPIISPFIHNHHIFIIIFDITDRISFADIDNFYNLIFDNVAAHDFKIIIFGNKVDLSSDRNVTYEEAIEKANSMDADYLEISCKNGYNFGLAIQLIKNAHEFRDVIGAGANHNAPKKPIARAVPGQKCVARATPGQSVFLYVICPNACS